MFIASQLALTTEHNVILVYFALRSVQRIAYFRPSHAGRLTKHDDTNIYAESDCPYSAVFYKSTKIFSCETITARKAIFIVLSSLLHLYYDLNNNREIIHNS